MLIYSVGYKNISGFQENKFTQSIINLLNKKGVHLNKKGVFVRQYSCPNLYSPVRKKMLQCSVTHSSAWGKNMSLLYSDNQGKTSFFFYSGNTLLQALILYFENNKFSKGSSDSHNYGRSYYVLVQKDHRKDFFMSWKEESSLRTPSEATRHSQDTQNEHRSCSSKNQKLMVYQSDVYWNRPWRF